MNLSIILGKILHWFSKIVSGLKEFGYLIAVIILLIFFVNKGCNNRQTERLIEKMSTIDTQNSILSQENKRLNKVLTVKDSLLIVKNLKIDSVKKVGKEKEEEGLHWKKKHDEIAGILNQISADSSYNFLQTVWNFPGSKKFPFNASQVKTIHQTYLENENKGYQLVSLKSVLFSCKEESTLLSDSHKIIEDKLTIKEHQYRNSNQIIENKEDQIKLLSKQLHRKSRKWFTGFGVGPELGISYDLLNSKSSITVGVGIHYDIYHW